MEILNWLSGGFASGYITGMFYVGLLLALSVLVGYVLAWAGLLLWCFVEDFKVIDATPASMKAEQFPISGGQHRLYSSDDPEDWIQEGCSKYYLKKDMTERFDCIIAGPFVICLLIAALAVILGIIIEACLWAPMFFSILFSGAGLVFLARGVRRLQKKLTKHINTIDAHKVQSEEA